MKRWKLVAAMATVTACSSQDRARPTPIPIDAAAPRDDKVLIPSGWFIAGCASFPASWPIDRASDAAPLEAGYCAKGNPPRRVWLSSFSIDRLEVTRAEYRSCIDAGACRGHLGEYLAFYALQPDLDRIEPRVPALVNYADADRFCHWRGDRLPTVAEWEKAARGSDGRSYPWGDAPPSCVLAPWTSEMGQAGLEPDHAHCPDLVQVGLHPDGRSPYGLEDLYGNAAEWTATWDGEFAATQPGELPVFHRVEREGSTIFEASWSETRYRLRYPAVIDPPGPSGPDGDRGHIVKGHPHLDGFIGANVPGYDEEIDQRAGIRCVRPMPGPPPPDVPAPAPGEFALPYREPGFVP